MSRGDPTASTLAFLEGALSRNRHDPDQLRGTDPSDGRTLLARYEIERARITLTRQAIAVRRGGLWRWEELLPVRSRKFITTLGEGSTPLLAGGRLSRNLGLGGLRVKAESMNPTGSFKARGMAVAVSRAVELGATHLVSPSSTASSPIAASSRASSARRRARSTWPPCASPTAWRVRRHLVSSWRRTSAGPCRTPSSIRPAAAPA